MHLRLCPFYIPLSENDSISVELMHIRKGIWHHQQLTSSPASLYPPLGPLTLSTAVTLSALTCQMPLAQSFPVPRAFRLTILIRLGMWLPSNVFAQCARCPGFRPKHYLGVVVRACDPSSPEQKAGDSQAISHSQTMWQGSPRWSDLKGKIKTIFTNFIFQVSKVAMMRRL